MVVSTKKSESDFQPFEITIKVQSKEESEILWRLSNLDSNRADDIINQPYAKSIDADAIKIVTDKIYYSVEHANVGLYENDAVPMRAGVPHELDAQINQGHQSEPYFLTKDIHDFALFLRQNELKPDKFSVEDWIKTVRK